MRLEARSRVVKKNAYEGKMVKHEAGLGSGVNEPARLGYHSCIANDNLNRVRS